MPMTEPVATATSPFTRMLFSLFLDSERLGPGSHELVVRKVFEGVKDDVPSLVSLSLALNHLSFYHFDKDERDWSDAYVRLWSEVHGWAMDNLEGEDLSAYYWSVD